jgi:hypothetical protein
MLALVVGIGAVHVARLDASHPWGDDFAMYILHARNLAEGLPYAQTGYIPDPQHFIGPPCYPPIYPLLLAPVYARFGLDFVALKGVTVACFLGFLLVMGLAFRRALTRPMLLGLLLLVGLNYFFLRDTNTINSDETLLTFLYLSLFLLHAARETVLGRWRIAAAIGVGVSAYLAFAARTVGFLLIPAILLEDLLNVRRIRSTTLLTTAVFAILAAAQELWLRGSQGYLGEFAGAGPALARHAVWYAERMAAFWSNGYCKPATGTLAAVVTLLAVLGYVERWRSRVTVCEIFLPLYLATILLWPGYGAERYLYPILPLWTFYALVGLQHPLLGSRRRLRGLVIAALLTAVSASYVARWTRLDDLRGAEGVGQPNSVAMFQFIAHHTRPSDVVVFIKPRAMALLAGRRASAYHQPAEDRQLCDYFHAIDARYVVTVERDAALGPAAPAELLQFLRGFVARHRSRFDEVYRNADFAVYKKNG